MGLSRVSACVTAAKPGLVRIVLPQAGFNVRESLDFSRDGQQSCVLIPSRTGGKSAAIMKLPVFASSQRPGYKVMAFQESLDDQGHSRRRSLAGRQRAAFGRSADFGLKSLDHLRDGFDVGAAKQIDAVGDGSENAVHHDRAIGRFHSLKGFPDRLRLPRQIEDQGLAANDTPADAKGWPSARSSG
jgi:hypothetical protein